uniref:Uncharacterized protein n=1 Tax=Arundo donax TaxID=35708 RepID=A0A0A9BMW0_ARUDO
MLSVSPILVVWLNNVILTLYHLQSC